MSVEGVPGIENLELLVSGPTPTFVGVPEYQGVGDICTVEFNAYFAGGSIDAALSLCQAAAAAETVG